MLEIIAQLPFFICLVFKYARPFFIVINLEFIETLLVLSGLSFLANVMLTLVIFGFDICICTRKPRLFFIIPSLILALTL